MIEQPPSISRSVHYVEPGTGNHLAAVITSVEDSGVGAAVEMVNLSVLGVNFFGLANDVPHDEEKRPGSWHWPERA